VKNRIVLPDGPEAHPHFELFAANRRNRLLTCMAQLIASAFD